MTNKVLKELETLVSLTNVDLNNDYHRGAKGVAVMALSAIKELREESGKLEEWQPIETAPKDKKVDLWNKNGRFTDCYYDDICDDWRRTGRSCILTRINKPTHWMPLPTKPKQS
tara:strand:+ start:438 stop:779 length:342 start_codon:yes stop_codon:yes gene_type:complete